MRQFPLLTEWKEVEEAILCARHSLQQSLPSSLWRNYKEFLVNKRDQPLATSSMPPGLEVFSQFVHEGYRDRPLVPLCDYKLANARVEEPPAWSQRVSGLIFRGSATGAGVTCETNVRLKLCALSHAWQDDTLLDAKLTSWNGRHKLSADGTIRVINPDDFPFYADKSFFLPPRAQQRWKYAILLDGNVGAARLLDLAAGFFTLLLPASDAPQVRWRSALVPWEHFVPLRADLGDLAERLLYLRANDDVAYSLAQNLHQTLSPMRRDKNLLNRTMREDLLSLEAPSEAIHASLSWIWSQCRAAIYCLLDDRMRLVLFLPFANASFTNDWHQSLKTDSESLPAFLAKAKRRFGGPLVTLPPERWWSNAGLVCNVMPRGIWGEAYLLELHALLVAQAQLSLSRPAILAATSSAGDDGEELQQSWSDPGHDTQRRGQRNQGSSSLTTRSSQAAQRRSFHHEQLTSSGTRRSAARRR